MAFGVRIDGWPERLGRAAAGSPYAWPGLAGVLALAAGLVWVVLGSAGQGDAAAAWVWQAPGPSSASPPSAPSPSPLSSPSSPPPIWPVWTWWTAALVHLSGWHLIANLLAAAAVAAWGWVAGCGTRATLAWLLAWPLAQALLITDPGSLWRYAGLSATLHAGVAIGCWHLIVHRRGAARAVGAAVLAAVGIKLMLEMPALRAWWQGVAVAELQPSPLAGAPGHILAGHAHGCGVAAGLIMALLLDGIMALRRRSSALPAPTPSP